MSGAKGDSSASPVPAEGHTHERVCLNCRSPLDGDYCRACGQKAHVHRTIGAFWHDLVHSVLHFEGKMWRTLPMLALRPGELTRRFIEGERARFVSPMAMFLFSVFLMFAIFGLAGDYAYRDRNSASYPTTSDTTVQRPQTAAELQQQAKDERAENLGEIQALEVARGRIAAAGRNIAAIDAEIADIRREMALDAQLLTPQLALQRSEDQRRARHRQQVEGVAIHPRSGPSLGWFDERYAKAKENPKLLLYKVQSNAYKFSWALIPISVPLLWLLFLSKRYRRRYTAYDHTVFVTYSIAFMSMFAIAYTLLKLAGMNGTVALAPLVIPPIHIYRQLRGAYQLSPWSALWRTGALIVFASIALSLFGILLIILGVAG